MENDVVYKAMTFCNIAIDILENKKKCSKLNGKRLLIEHKRVFLFWFKDLVLHNDNVSYVIKWLAHGEDNIHVIRDDCNIPKIQLIIRNQMILLLEILVIIYKKEIN